MKYLPSTASNIWVTCITVLCLFHSLPQSFVCISARIGTQIRTYQAAKLLVRPAQSRIHPFKREGNSISLTSAYILETRVKVLFLLRSLTPQLGYRILRPSFATGASDVNRNLLKFPSPPSSRSGSPDLNPLDRCLSHPRGRGCDEASCMRSALGGTSTLD